MESISKKLAKGNYRSAAEEIVEKMRSIAEESENEEVANELDLILEKLFNLPNIDWKKVEEHGVWEVSSFIK